MSDWYPTDAEINTAWSYFPGSPMQFVFHKFMEARLKGTRSQLETCQAADLAKLQGQVAEIKSLMDLLHSKDPAQVKALYAERY